MLPDPVALAHRSALRSIARIVEETATPTDPAVALHAVADQLRAGNTLVVTQGSPLIPVFPTTVARPARWGGIVR